MAEERSLKERLSVIDKLSASINKNAKKVIMGRIGMNDAIAEKLRIKFIPTVSDKINALMGGGYPRGRTTLIAGKEDSGKTSRLLEDIGYNMKKNPEFLAGWLESEGSLEESYLISFGIDPKRFVYFEIDRESAAEIALDRVESLLATKSLDIMVVNSLKCLVPKAEYEGSMEDSQVALQARMNNKMQRKFTAIISEANVAYVLITHLHTDIGSHSYDPLVISGGLGIRFGAAIILDFRKRSVLKEDPITVNEGMKFNITQKKNHCTPGRNIYLKLDYYIIFGQGTEQIMTTFDEAIEFGILKQAGSWYRWYENDGETIRHQWNGKTKYRQFMNENPEILSELKSLLLPENKIQSLSSVEVAAIKAAEEKDLADVASIVSSTAEED